MAKFNEIKLVDVCMTNWCIQSINFCVFDLSGMTTLHHTRIRKSMVSTGMKDRHFEILLHNNLFIVIQLLVNLQITVLRCLFSSLMHTIGMIFYIIFCGYDFYKFRCFPYAHYNEDYNIVCSDCVYITTLCKSESQILLLSVLECCVCICVCVFFFTLLCFLFCCQNCTVSSDFHNYEYGLFDFKKDLA